MTEERVRPEAEETSFNRRIPQLDLARVLATLLVVFNHSSETVYTMQLPQWGGYSAAGKWFCCLTFCLGRIGVPIFFLLSGALVFPRIISRGGDILL